MSRYFQSPYAVQIFVPKNIFIREMESPVTG